MAIPTPLKRTDNVSVLNALWNEGSPQYQARIPLATQGAVTATLDALTTFRPLYNEFVSALVNRIGTVYCRNNAWTNPLAEFKRGMLMHGNTIEEVQTGLLKAHTYEPDRDYLENALFSTELPDVKSAFHTINRQNFYKVTLNDMLLRRAFVTDTGITDYLGQLMQAPSTSDSWDEFLITSRLFAEYEKRGGFFRVHVPEIVNAESADGAEARYFLRAVRAMAENLKFLSTKYNAAHMPIAAQPTELVLFTTPEFKAAVDVDALAAAFNLDKATVPTRIITIPKEYFNIDGCQAILTTKDFFVIADTLLEATSQWNPVSLSTNHFLHHQSVLSTSLFAPAIMFTSKEGDVVDVRVSNVTTVSAITLEAIDGVVPTEVQRGGMVSMLAQGVDANAGAVNSGVRWLLAGASSIWSYITPEGVLHVGADETATTLNVTAVATWIDPNNPRNNAATATKAVTVATLPAANVLWPETGVVKVISIKGYDTNIVQGTTAYTVTATGSTIPAKSDVVVQGTGVSTKSVNIAVNAALGWIVTIVTDAGVNSPEVTYVMTYNK